MKLDVDYEDYLEAEVFDRAGRLVGNLDCYWEDEDGETEFLGIKMKSVPGKTAVVPTRLAEANERKSCVLLGLGEPTITEGPSLDCDEELDQLFEERVYAHYGLSSPLKQHRLQIHRSEK